MEMLTMPYSSSSRGTGTGTNRCRKEQQVSFLITRITIATVTVILILTVQVRLGASQEHQNNNDDNDNNNYFNTNTNNNKNRMQRAKLDLWRRGEFEFPDFMSSTSQAGDGHAEATAAGAASSMIQANRVLQAEQYSRYMARGRPIQQARSGAISHNHNGEDNGWNWLSALRGGGGLDADVADDDTSYAQKEKQQIAQLGTQYGSAFLQAIQQNKNEHDEDCRKSCELFYCAPAEEGADAGDVTTTTNTDTNNTNNNTNTFHSYSMGAVPPEDFASQFGFPLDLIKVSKQPVIDPTEAARVVQMAESEGLSHNEYQSGKYKLGGNWLDREDTLVQTRAWFNKVLETTLFPLMANLFPEVVKSASVLRAHSVSLLKYNVTHPRTDVHVDNGILAMTISMNSMHEYEGGGTFFEHMGGTMDVANRIEMDVGYGTFRPGSVRHGGAPVTQGQRYILGAFLLLENKVEHVRRLKNRGSDLRKAGSLENAAQHFEWALAMNPKCTTCLKDWAEVLHAQTHYEQAEIKIRKALFLLEQKDSDALFTLGMILSEQGTKEEESIDAYLQSIALNAEDAELCYNLGMKLGSVRKDTKGELDMYQKAVAIDPAMGGAWINWGTSLAEAGDLEGAELKFQSALKNDPQHVGIKALMNLALVNQARANQCAAILGDLPQAKTHAQMSGAQLDAAKELMDGLSPKEKQDVDMAANVAQYTPLRLTSHKLLGQVWAGLGDMDECAAEFRNATTNFPNHIGAWEMLAKVLERLGKTDEAVEIKRKIQMLQALL
jgi:tetratricopeptide (TPR) repeat protein